jgi:hypothetical protein
VAKACGLTERSQQLLKDAAASEVVADASWAVKAQQLLGIPGSAEQQEKLQRSLASAERVKDTSSFTGWWWYNVGTMEMGLAHKDRAKAAFRRAILLPDSMMSHHLARAALTDVATQ